MKKLWSGRFDTASDKAAEQFNASLPFDYKLYRHDIEGSIAHCAMLGEQGIIPKEDAALIIKGLKQILADIQSGKLVPSEGEDIHSFVEFELVKLIGDVGKKLHTGRSRNDQVALDMRMYLKDSINDTVKRLKNLCYTLLETAQNHLYSYMPGYTHMQKAQPVTLAHYLCAYAAMFLRDIDRFKDCYRRTDVMPLGSGALATTTYPLNRDRVKELLGFSQITLNSLDAVSDRDFVIEYLFAASLSAMHMSRFCEELIYWSGEEFGFVQISDAYATGSSIMPNKKNPDMCELIRGKTGRVYGNLIALLTALKGLPLAYNKDMQEDKEPVFDTENTINNCIDILTAIIKTARFDTAKMKSAAEGGYSQATDIADYLVKKGLPFRTAHEITGKMVLDCVKSGKKLTDLTLSEFTRYSELFENDIFDAIDIAAIVNKRNLPGGPAPDAVKATIESYKKQLEEL